MHEGTKSCSIFSNTDIIHVESPIHEAELKPPSFKVTTLDINLKHSNKPDNMDLGIVTPVLSRVTQDLVAKM